MTIYDEDQLYCKRLGFYLRENTKLPFQIYPLTTPDALLQFQKKKEADLLLLSEKNAKTLPFSPKSKKTFLLTEENDCAKTKGESSIYKYQSADRIMREILLKYGELSLLEGSGQGGIQSAWKIRKNNSCSFHCTDTGQKQKNFIPFSL